jgi:hypothetical protein
MPEAIVGAFGRDPRAEGDLREAHDQHGVDRNHEPVGGHRERSSRLLDAAQVDHSQEPDEPNRERDGVMGERGHRARDGGHARNYRHGNGEHVVDQQRRGRDQRCVFTEIVATHGVGAASVRVCEAGLTIGSDDDQQQQDHRCRQPRREVEQGQPPKPKDQHDLLGGVRDRRQRVRAEDGQRQPLGK